MSILDMPQEIYYKILGYLQREEQTNFYLISQSVNSAIDNNTKIAASFEANDVQIDLSFLIHKSLGLLNNKKLFDEFLLTLVQRILQDNVAIKFFVVKYLPYLIAEYKPFKSMKYLSDYFVPPATRICYQQLNCKMGCKNKCCNYFETKIYKHLEKEDELAKYGAFFNQTNLRLIFRFFMAINPESTTKIFFNDDKGYKRKFLPHETFDWLNEDIFMEMHNHGIYTKEISSKYNRFAYRVNPIFGDLYWKFGTQKK